MIKDLIFRPFLFWSRRSEFNDKQFDQLSLDFQPASLSIQNTPPHPTSKLVARILMGVFTFGVLWACIGKVDIVASAEGRLIPQSRIKVVQPLELGSVTQLLVTEGQRVKQGDILIEIDATQVRSIVKQLQAQLSDLQERVNSLGVLLVDIQLAEPSRHLNLTGIPTAYHAWVQSQWADYVEQAMVYKQKIYTHEQTMMTVEAVVAKYELTSPIISDRAKSMFSMYEKKLASKLEYLTVEQERIEMEQDLIAERKRLLSMSSELLGLKAQHAAFRAGMKKNWQQLRLDYKKEALGITQELYKAQDRLSKHTLSSPVDGVVKNLAITTIGAVVSPADELMTIVPTSDTLQMEAYIENKDIGFIAEGQSVEVKISTFNFTKYGVIDGELIHVSDDAIQDERRGFIFPVRIELAKDYLYFDGKKLILHPGMEAGVEIKIGKRRLIEFFLAPLLRHKAESLSER